jgi:hypothetical protein
VSAPALHLDDRGFNRGEVKIPVHCLPSLAHVAILTEYAELRAVLSDDEELWYVYTADGHRRYSIGNDSGALLAIEYLDEDDEWQSYAPSALREAFLRRPAGPTPHLTSITERENPVLGTYYVWHCTCGVTSDRPDAMPHALRDRAERAAEQHRAAFQ